MDVCKYLNTISIWTFCILFSYVNVNYIDTNTKAYGMWCVCVCELYNSLHLYVILDQGLNQSRKTYVNIRSLHWTQLYTTAFYKTTVSFIRIVWIYLIEYLLLYRQYTTFINKCVSFFVWKICCFSLISFCFFLLFCIACFVDLLKI